MLLKINLPQCSSSMKSVWTILKKYGLGLTYNTSAIYGIPISHDVFFNLKSWLKQYSIQCKSTRVTEVHNNELKHNELNNAVTKNDSNNNQTAVYCYDEETPDVIFLPLKRLVVASISEDLGHEAPDCLSLGLLTCWLFVLRSSPQLYEPHQVYSRQ